MRCVIKIAFFTILLVNLLASSESRSVQNAVGTSLFGKIQLVKEFNQKFLFRLRIHSMVSIFNILSVVIIENLVQLSTFPSSWTRTGNRWNPRKNIFNWSRNTSVEVGTTHSATLRHCHPRIASDFWNILMNRNNRRKFAC